MQSVLKIHYAATEELAAEHTASEAMTPRTRPLQCRLGFALLLLQTALTWRCVGLTKGGKKCTLDTLQKLQL